MYRRFSHEITCLMCMGTRMDAQGYPCPSCDGTGRVPARPPSRDWKPFDETTQACVACGGNGIYIAPDDIPKDDQDRFNVRFNDEHGKCRYCRGSGSMSKSKAIGLLLASSLFREPSPEMPPIPSPIIIQQAPQGTQKIRLADSQLWLIIRALRDGMREALTGRQRAIHPTPVTRPEHPAPTLPLRRQRRWWQMILFSGGVMTLLTGGVFALTLLTSIPTINLVGAVAGPDLSTPTPTVTHPLVSAPTRTPTVHVAPTIARPTALPTSTPTPLPTATPTPLPPTLAITPGQFSVTCPRTSVVLALQNVGTGTLNWTATVSGAYYAVNGVKSANGTLMGGTGAFYLTVTSIYGSGYVKVAALGQTTIVPITCV